MGWDMGWDEGTGLCLRGGECIAAGSRGDPRRAGAGAAAGRVGEGGDGKGGRRGLEPEGALAWGGSRRPGRAPQGLGGWRETSPSFSSFSESQSRRGWKGPQEIIESSLPANQIPYNSSHRLTSINSRRGTENMVEDVYQLILVTKTPHFVEIGELRQVISVTFLKK
eukprot:XP_025004921.1 uncharacterized protein LOC101751895 [Gallus gallus]